MEKRADTGYPLDSTHLTELYSCSGTERSAVNEKKAWYRPHRREHTMPGHEGWQWVREEVAEGGEEGGESPW